MDVIQRIADENPGHVIDRVHATVACYGSNAPVAQFKDAFKTCVARLFFGFLHVIQLVQRKVRGHRVRLHLRFFFSVSINGAVRFPFPQVYASGLQNDMNITHLCLSGGGMAGLAYIGLLQCLQEHQMRARIREVSGCSIGAQFAALWALDVPMTDVEAYMKRFMRRLPLAGTMAWAGVWRTWGINDGAILTAPLRHFMLQRGLSPAMTLMDFVKHTGCAVTFLATDMAHGGVGVRLNVATAPDLPLLLAVQASMTIPCVFAPVRWGGQLLVDGGVAAKMDLHPEFRKQTTLYVMISGTLAGDEPPTDAMTYAASLIRSFFVNNDRALMDRLAPAEVLVLEESPIPFLPLAYDAEGKEWRVCISESSLARAVAYGRESVSCRFREHEQDELNRKK
jgi:predicted acylesterase/phospholipase RssA